MEKNIVSILFEIETNIYPVGSSFGGIVCVKEFRGKKKKRMKPIQHLSGALRFGAGATWGGFIKRAVFWALLQPG